MAFDFTKLCFNYGIPIANREHRHYRNGWVNVPCPYCSGNPGYHLGFKYDSFGFVCYRCRNKFHSMIETIALLLNVNVHEAVGLIRMYGGQTNTSITIKRKVYDLENDAKLPIGTRQLNSIGISYLEKRGYNVDELQTVWKAQQTGLIGSLRHRIVIPIHFREQLISWTCRDYTNKHPIRYLSCPSEKECVPHKEILYGIDHVINKHKVVVVEGCLDVWKMGKGCVATFGTAITPNQIKLLMNFRKVVFYTDNDEAGILSYKKACSRLHTAGIASKVEICHKGDAGELDIEEARYVMNHL